MVPLSSTAAEYPTKQLPTWKLISALAYLIFASGQLSAQTEVAPKRGVYLSGSYSVSDFETVNNTNGNVMFSFPLASLPPGRGGMSYGVTLNYNSKLFDVRTDEFFVPPSGFEGEVMRAYKSETGGWRYGVGYRFEQKKRPVVPEFHNNTSEVCHSPAQPNYKYFDIYKFVLTMPDGSQKEFTPVMNFGTGVYDSTYQDGYHSVDINGKYRRWRDIYVLGDWVGCEIDYYQHTGGLTFYSTDDSFLRLDVAHDGDSSWSNNPWTLTTPDGTRVVQFAPLSGEVNARQRVIDRNDNYVEIQKPNPTAGSEVVQVTDQLGRGLTINQNLQTLEDTITVKGVNGVDLNWTVKWKNIGVSRQYRMTDACCVTIPPSTAAAVAKVVDEIVLPSQLGGLSYGFDYNGNPNGDIGTASHGFGEISRVELPSGATVEYDYRLDGTQPQIPLWKDVLLNPLEAKKLTYQTEYDGQTSTKLEEWDYNIGLTEAAIIEPDGGVGRTYYNHVLDSDGRVTGVESPSGVSRGKRPVEYGPATQPYAASGRKLWQNLTAAETTAVKDASGNFTIMAVRAFEYDMNGNVVRVKEYDWIPISTQLNQYGEPVGHSPARTIETNYYNATPNIRDHALPNLDTTYLYTKPTAPKIKNAVKSSEIKDSTGVSKSRTEMFYDDASATANPTLTKTWDSFKGGQTRAYSNPLTAANSIGTSATYNQYGVPLTTTDANGVVTQTTYGSITTPTGAVFDLYPTQTVSAYGTSVARTSTAAYDFHTGLVTTATDADNNVSVVTEYDALGRPTKVRSAANTPLESWTRTEYNDTARRVVVHSDIETIGDGRKVAVQHYDQLGRVRLSRTLENASTEDPYNEQHGIKVQSRYATGNPNSYQLTSNPYRAATSAAASTEPTMGWTRSKSWNHGRRSETETFSGASLPAPWGTNTNTTGVVVTETDANAATVTDQAGRQRRNILNAFGQLIRVDEPNNAGQLGSVAAPNQPTYYSYDALGKMVHVQQDIQHRWFMHDSLGRMIRVKQPEQTVNTALNTTGNPGNNSWTAAFTYDNNGNALTATDAKDITVTNTYDALNRALTRAYEDGTPAVVFTYDDPTIPLSKGKLTKVASSVSESRYTQFDLLGRTKQFKQITDGQTYTSSYEYNLAGALIKETYPSGREVRNELDTDGDISRIFGKTTQTATERTYANTFSYTADGRIEKLRLGNGLWEAAKFNNRMQVTEFALGRGVASGDVWKNNYEFGELQTNGTVDATKNSGNIAKQTVTFSGLANPFVQTYKYDSLYRLTEAKETNNGNQTWRQAFTYDRYGNRLTHQKFIGDNQLTLTVAQHPAINATDNRFSAGQGFTFDANGNMIVDADGRQFTFNGDNKQTEVKDVGNNVVGRYWYDGEGKRIKKITNTETTVFVYSGAKLIAEYSTATPPANPTTSYTVTDQLGSPRVIVNALGEVVSRRDFMPFGEEIAPDGTYRTTGRKYGTPDSVRQKFTGYLKDEETGLDFAEARMYQNLHGRFTAVDPLLASGKSNNPQTFNRYVYVMNAPLKHSDPTGLQAAERVQNVYPCGIGAACDYTVSGNVLKVNTRELASAEVRADNSPLQPVSTETEISNVIGTHPLENPQGYINEQVARGIESGVNQARDAAYDVAPDYGKFSVGFASVSLEVTMSKDFRFYGGLNVTSNPFAEDGNGGFNAKPVPQFSVGYFVNGVNSEESRHRALAGPNASASVPLTPLLPLGVGINKSVPDAPNVSILSTPTAVEIGTPSAGAGFGASGEILPSVRDFIRRRFGRPPVEENQ